MTDLTKEIDGSGLRFNTNKINFSLISPIFRWNLRELLRANNSVAGFSSIPLDALALLAEHTNLGKLKYADSQVSENLTFANWAKGQLFDASNFASLQRHFYHYVSGETYDQEFGSHLMISVAWGFMTLTHFFGNYENYGKFDDRPWQGFGDVSVNVQTRLISGAELVSEIERMILALQTVDDPPLAMIQASYGGFLSLVLVHYDLQKDYRELVYKPPLVYQNSLNLMIEPGRLANVLSKVEGSNGQQ